MKLLSVVFLATLLFAAFANASITPVLDGSPTLITTGLYTGDYLWSYEISVDSLEALNSGLPGGTFFDIDGFVGYVPGSPITAPTGASTGWSGAPVSGDLDFTYTGSSVYTPTSEVPGFTAISSDSAINPLGGQIYQAEYIPTGGVDNGSGPVQVPMASTPEPVSVGLLGGALLGLAVLSRRKFARQ
jgi:hypothetical protein